MQSFLEYLDKELSKQPSFKRPPAKTIRKRRTISKTDPDSGCVNHGKYNSTLLYNEFYHTEGEVFYNRATPLILEV